ncbi:NAD(P)-binding protein [Ganoderma leucocontextum]|nr:NAD(P)-binding protein [Ganoderma leucocontextum]
MLSLPASFTPPLLIPSTFHSVKRYLHGEAPYAIVTGATAGIGKATAVELLTHGVNIILHGRDGAKMQKVVEELRASVKGKADTKRTPPTSGTSSRTHRRAGTTLQTWADESTEEHILSEVHMNALFSLFLTRVLLPQLRRAARAGPLCRFASKGFLQSLARGLDNDAPTGLRFTYLAVGAVHSDNRPSSTPPSLTVPTSVRFAWSVVESIGYGRRRIVPYIVHAVQFCDRAVDLIQARTMQSLIARSAKRK